MGWDIEHVAKYAFGLVLFALLAWAVRLAMKDVAWVYGVDSEYAKFRDRNINRISNPNTVRDYIEDLKAFGSERVDATRARSARLLLLGGAIPGLVLLLSIAMHSWLTDGECPFQPGPCGPTLKDALLFVGWNFLADLPTELATAIGATAPSDLAHANTKLLQILALFVRYNAGAHILALLYFEYRVWQIRRFINQQKAEAEAKIAPSVVAGALAAAGN